MDQTTSNRPELSASRKPYLSANALEYVSKGYPEGIDGLYAIVSNSQIIDHIFQYIPYKFNNKNILLRALTHSSFAHEAKPLAIKSNERLEFLGDSLLGSLVTVALYERYPELKEGELSKFRGALVNELSWANLAIILRLEDSLLLGKGEYQALRGKENRILSNSFEAIWGAIAVDSDFNWIILKSLFDQFILKANSETNIEFYDKEKLLSFDAKSALQEMTMKLYKTIPEYRSTSVGEDFFIELLINGKIVGSTNSYSKKKAERSLAKQVLNEWSEKNNESFKGDIEC
jgi:ribonuclease-3